MRKLVIIYMLPLLWKFIILPLYSIINFHNNGNIYISLISPSTILGSQLFYFTCIILISYCKVVLFHIFLAWNKEYEWCQGIIRCMCEAPGPPGDLQLLHYSEADCLIPLSLHWPTHIPEITKHMTVALLIWKI